MPFEVHQHGAVGVALTQCPVIDAKYGRGHDGWHGRLPYYVQQRVAAGDKPKLATETHPGRAAQRQAHRREPIGEPRRLASPRRCNAGQAFGEDMTLAQSVVAEHAAHPELDGDGMLAPGQVSERPFVAAVRSFGSPSAKRTSGLTRPRAEGDGDRGRGGLKAPSFEPDRSRIRQQARKEVHSINMGTLRYESPKAYVDGPGEATFVALIGFRGGEASTGKRGWGPLVYEQKRE